MRVRTHDSFEEASLNLAPLIDVVFLLLIFFMVVTTFAKDEQEIPLDVPQAETGEQVRELPDELVIQLTRSGEIHFAGRAVDEQGLRDALADAARAKGPDVPVTVRGDGEVALQKAVTVLDACRTAGLSNVGVATREL